MGPAEFQGDGGESLHERRDNRAHHLLWTLPLCCVLCLVAVRPIQAQFYTPDWTRYTVGLPPPPTGGKDANTTFNQRAQTYTQFLACGQENVFLDLAMQKPSNFIDDNILDRVMAKLWWLKTVKDTDCTGVFNVIFVDGTAVDFLCQERNPQDGTCKTPFQDTQHFVAQMQTTFGESCSSGSFEVKAAGKRGNPPTLPDNGVFATVKSRVSRDCLAAQINFVLSQVKRRDSNGNTLFPGTSGLPCDLSTLGNPPFSGLGTNGDWDMRMRTLIRILFLDQMYLRTGHPSILGEFRPPPEYPNDSNLWGYVQDELIIVDGGPGPDSYSWTACGDNEADTGTPQDREDENGFWDGAFDSIGDIASWLCHRLVLILVFFTVAAAIVYLTGLTGLAASVLTAIGIAAILAGQIPETENHRLMIESTRFLNNQLTIQQRGGASQAPNISDAQQDVRNWLLNKFQEIAKNEFNEYNARPYHGISLSALRNLADFSTDPDVRNGAQMLIEYSAAKFALGSSQGRRLVPFRRHFAGVDCIDGHPCGGAVGLINNTAYAEIFNNFYQLGDGGVSFGLLFNGQTQQLPFGFVSTGQPAAPFGGKPGSATGSNITVTSFGGALGDAYAAATSQFVPNALIADLAINKDRPYLQRFHHHGGYEIYSSSPSALITAGGIETDHASKFSIGIDIGNFGSDDLGAGVPTTVMFTGAPIGPTDKGQLYSKMTLDSFISFRGTRDTHGGSETFTDNLCVWQNFACGTNVHIPNDIVQCLTHDPHNLGVHWFFFDSSNCFGYDRVPRFFVVMYLICPQDTCHGDLQNVGAGFLEVIDKPSESIGAFEQMVIQRNPPSPELANLGQGCLTSDGACTGHYHTMNGATSHNLEIALRGHQDAHNKTGITSVDHFSVNELGDWNFAEGDIINSQGDGVISIKNPRLGTELILDFSDVNHPCRRTGPNQPCTQQ